MLIDVNTCATFRYRGGKEPRSSRNRTRFFFFRREGVFFDRCWGDSREWATIKSVCRRGVFRTAVTSGEARAPSPTDSIHGPSPAPQHRNVPAVSVYLCVEEHRAALTVLGSGGRCGYSGATAAHRDRAVTVSAQRLHSVAALWACCTVQCTPYV